MARVVEAVVVAVAVVAAVTDMMKPAMRLLHN